MTIGQRAVVLGAGTGGLLAARALADFYEIVTVLERDALPSESAQRPYCPQRQPTHALLAGGSRILDLLFPGLLDEMVVHGVPVLDCGDMSKAFVCYDRNLLVRSDHHKGHAPLYLPSRSPLECAVERRVYAIPNVTVLDDYDVVALTSTAQRDRVTGAEVRCHNDGSERVLNADLVVDATGGGSRTPAFLSSLGYDRPPEEHIDVRLTCCSQLLHMPPGSLRELGVYVSPGPDHATGMALFRYDNDTWMLTLIGMAEHEPPTDRDDMLSDAEYFAPDHVMAALRAATPLSEVVHHRVPPSLWRRYDKIREFPAGLLVFGDAICSFNTMYGEGVTVAAMQALALQGCLREDERDLARRYFRATARAIRVSWALSPAAMVGPTVSGV